MMSSMSFTGTEIKQRGLGKALSSIDIDEGVRIEYRGKKMFVNRNPSGIFVVQIGDEFYYLDSAVQVIRLAGNVFGKKYEVYIY